MSKTQITRSYVRQVCLISSLAFALAAAPMLAHAEEPNFPDGKIPAAFQQPVGYTIDKFKNADGLMIRYGHLAAAGEKKGTIVQVGGKSEFLEKYYELHGELSAAGYDVWTMDWAGQGGSDRYLADKAKSHAIAYEHRIADFHQLVTTIVKPDTTKPVILMAHSMGGNLSFRYLQMHPGTFTKAVMTAPFVGFIKSDLPEPVMRFVARAAHLIGFSESYFPGSGPYVFDPTRKPEDSKVSSDPLRYSLLEDWFIANPELVTGGPTFGWGVAALDSVDTMDSPGFYESIKIPVLMAQPLKEFYVSLDKQAEACKRLPSCTLYPVEGAMHELWHEQEKYRGPWKAKVLEFLAQ